MLSLSRAVGECLDLFVDYDKNPRLVALIKRLGGDPDELSDLADRVTIQYTRHADEVNGNRLSEPEVFLAINAPQHVEVWRSELLKKELQRV